jgi:hypothetical protein
MPPETETRRGFGIADGLVLVAATAAGLGLGRALEPDLPLWAVWGIVLRRPAAGWSFAEAVAKCRDFAAFVAAPSLAAWTVGAFVLHLRRPRPRGRLRVRRPGWMACLAASAVILIAAVLALWIGWTSGFARLTRGGRLLVLVVFGATYAGAAVFWTWAAMAVSGRWRPSPSWTDRLGRVLGVAWILLGLIYASSGFAEALR